MKVAAAVLTLFVTSAVLSFADGSRTYVGVITDTMCAGDHAAMKVTGVLYLKTNILKVDRIERLN